MTELKPIEYIKHAKIGDAVFVCNNDTRREPETRVIIGQTRTSWLVSNWRGSQKFSKSNFKARGTYCGYADYLAGTKDLSNMAWAKRNRPYIVNAVDACDFETLRKVAELIGHKER